MTEMKVDLVDYMGTDDSVANSARVSFSKRAKNFTKLQNENLIKFLARKKHEIPFAHTAITLRAKAPISIRTQCFKHKVGFVENEVIRRYVTDKPEYFVPDFRTKPEGNIKQGSGGLHANNEMLQGVYEQHLKDSISLYESLLANGVAPEQARFILPQGVMTEWIWTGSLLAFARFYNLRIKPDAQAEIRQLAERVSEIIKPLFPVSWEALTGETQ